MAHEKVSSSPLIYSQWRLCCSQLLLKCETDPSLHQLYKELQLLYFCHLAAESIHIQEWEQGTKLNTGNWIQGILLVLTGLETV